MPLPLDDKVCYRALLCRDDRFDGRFFAGVKTTGIYCRSTCPARKPKKSNVVFYAMAAEAESDGFRPCLRCRPESTPGSPDWMPGAHTVTRGLRLVHEGYLDDHRVPELSARLGLSERQLDRLFLEKLGATPAALARTQRVHLARRLLAETQMSITQIALAAGYGSLRRFNTCFKAAYGCAPREMRQGSKAKATGGGITLRLPYRPPFSFSKLLRYLEPRGIPGVEEISARLYRRTVSFGENTGCIEVRKIPHESALSLHIPGQLQAQIAMIATRVQRLFDLRSDLNNIRAQLRKDTNLREFPALAHVRLPGAFDPFEMAVRAILGQQVSVKGASTIAGRLAAGAGTQVQGGSSTLTHTFPTAKQLAQIEIGAIGIPRKRALAITELAVAVAKGHVDLSPAADVAHTRQALLDLPGIGPWTTDYICMRAMSQPDFFPTGDLGLQKAMAQHPSERVTEKELRTLSQTWRPWRSYAAMAIWMSGCQRKNQG